VFPEQAAAGMLDVYRRVTETGQPYAEPELWYEDTWGDGQRARRCFDVRASRVGDGFMVLTRDVTSDREREQELARRQRGLERSNSELRQLNELSELLAGCQSADEAFHVFAGVAHRLFPVQGGALSWIRDSREEVEAVAGWARGAQVRSFDPLSCWAIRRGQQHVSTDDVPICPHFRDQAVEHGLCVPMAAQGQTVGVLHLIATDPRVLDPALQQLAATAAAQLSLAISNLELRETLRGLAIRDPLTGLFNRRYMEETLSRELARAAREEEVLTLLQLDVDHFKRFNDDYGHDAGDAVLRALSQVLRAVFRDSDVVCRFGGEEFTVVCPGVDEVGARARYRELQTRLDALRLPFRDKVLPPVTVSAGAAHYPRHAHEADDLMRLADQALYAAKRGGRDQLVVADLAPPP
jgi:diguanylate cyclase (GGDEF)-like protein